MTGPVVPAAVTDDPWATLRQFTDARIGLGRAGISLPTQAVLAFQLAHAQARDAVHQPLDTARLVQDLAGIAGLSRAIVLTSAAADRADYLRNPPKGRMLADARDPGLAAAGQDADLAIVIADGLSARAVQDNAVPFLAALRGAAPDLRLSPPVVVTQGRVAIGDQIGQILRARAVMVLIGERPGLSSPDSLGVYFTWAPVAGLRDDRRNCISNIRPAGLDPVSAAHRAAWLFHQAVQLGLSGVALKDTTTALPQIARGAYPA